MDTHFRVILHHICQRQRICPVYQISSIRIQANGVFYTTAVVVPDACFIHHFTLIFCGILGPLLCLVGASHASFVARRLRMIPETIRFSCCIRIQLLLADLAFYNQRINACIQLGSILCICARKLQPYFPVLLRSCNLINTVSAGNSTVLRNGNRSHAGKITFSPDFFQLHSLRERVQNGKHTAFFCQCCRNFPGQRSVCIFLTRCFGTSVFICFDDTALFIFIIRIRLSLPDSDFIAEPGGSDRSIRNVRRCFVCKNQFFRTIWHSKGIL